MCHNRDSFQFMSSHISNNPGTNKFLGKNIRFNFIARFRKNLACIVMMTKEEVCNTFEKESHRNVKQN